MAKKHADLPRELIPFAELGVVFTGRSGSTHRVADCPFCGKENHLFVRDDNGQYKCHVCGASGNRVTFMNEILKQARKSVPKGGWAKLGAARSLPPEAFLPWSIGWNEITDEWLIPHFDPDGKLQNLGRWKGPKGPILSLTGCKKQLYGGEVLAKAERKLPVWVMAGEWDAHAMRWLLRKHGRPDVVVAVPGETTWKPEWLELFDGRDVRLCYDADDTGDRGSMKAALALKERGQARSIKFLCWPQNAPKGFDVRDWVAHGLEEHSDELPQVLANLEKLLRSEHRLGTNAAQALGFEDADVDVGMAPPEHIPKWLEVLQAFREELNMDQDMIWALSISLATIVSVELEKDPIWIYLISPPGGGKTTILQTLRKSPRCVFRSSLTPASLVSGFAAAKDPSLLPKLNNKCGIFKDGTELLAMHPIARAEVMGILRGAYDGDVDRSYGNAVQRTYHNLNFTLLIGMTPAVGGDSMVTLGERFLRFHLQKTGAEEDVLTLAMDSIVGGQERDDKLQDVIAAFLWRKISDGDGKLPDCSPEFRSQIMALARLVSFLRAKVEYDQNGGERSVRYRPYREIATRLVKQLFKLALCVAWVWGLRAVDERVMRLLRRVAYDTAEGFSLEASMMLMAVGGSGTIGSVAEKLGLGYERVRRVLEDGALLRYVRPVVGPAQGGRPSKVWTLDAELQKLLREARVQKEWVDETLRRKTEHHSKEATNEAVRVDRG